MLSDGSLGDLVLTGSPFILAAIVVFILAMVRMGSRPGAAFLAMVAAVLFGLGSLIRIIGIFLLVENAHDWGLAYDSGWFDIVGWGSTILMALAFVLLAVAFANGSSRPRQAPAPGPQWGPPPPYGHPR